MAQAGINTGLPNAPTAKLTNGNKLMAWIILEKYRLNLVFLLKDNSKHAVRLN